MHIFIYLFYFFVQQYFSNKPNENKSSRKFPIPGVKDIIIVASGKGGVGKSTVAGTFKF